MGHQSTVLSKLNTKRGFKQNRQQPADASHGLYTHIAKHANSNIRQYQNMIHKLLHDNSDEFSRVQHKLHTFTR